MITLNVDLDALLHGIVYLEAVSPVEGDEELSEEIENKYGFHELEVSSNGELLYLNHALIAGEKELEWLINAAKIFRGSYSVPKLGIKNASLQEVLKALTELLTLLGKSNVISFKTKWKFDEDFGDKYIPLPHLAYLTEINFYNYENELIDANEFWSYLFRLEYDLKDPNIPCGEKGIALKILYENLKEFLRVNPDYVWIFPTNKDAPKTHWWWHPELWNKNIDPFEVLNEVCPKLNPNN
jgi:hypothetical protein